MSFFTTGIETSTVQAEAVNAILIAANGNASSSFANAAVPSPCAAAPIPTPLATASFIPAASNIAAPKLAPINPVTTTILTASQTHICPRSNAHTISRGMVLSRESAHFVVLNMGLEI